MPDFDFATLGYALAGLSLGLIGVILAGAVLFPEMAEKAKRTWLPSVITGVIMIGVAGFILNALGGQLPVQIEVARLGLYLRRQ